MAKVARFSKISKLIRLMRLVKIFKIMKNSGKIKAHFSASIALGQGLERLLNIALQFLFTNHIFACLWILLGKMSEVSFRDVWYHDRGHSDFDTYIHAFYFTVQTMTTVGYGDMSIATTYERLFCIVLMVCGVVIFTLISGSLASVLSN